jgi:hypothetical protein
MNKINKTAYPQGHADTHIKSYDLNKWTKTSHDISIYARQGYDYNKIKDELTKNWDEMEKKDFAHWMKYYQSNSQNAYKKAQYLEVAPGAFVPGAMLSSSPDLNDLKTKIKLPEEEDPQFKINKKIRSILNRLTSAEKLATDPDVQRELSKRLDIGLHKWLEELQRVKRLIQIAPIKHANSSILEDLIFKEANILAHKGFPKTAQELIKVAQLIPTPKDPQGSPPAPAPAPNLPGGPPGPPLDMPPPPDAPPGAPPGPGVPPGGPPGAPPAPPGGGLIPTDPSQLPPLKPNPPKPAEKPKPKGQEALDEMLGNLNSNKNKDNNNIVDPLVDDLAGMTIQAKEDEFAEIEIVAQALPPEMATTPVDVPFSAPSAIPVPSPEPTGLPNANLPASTPVKAPPASAVKPKPTIEVSEDEDKFADTVIHKKTDDLLESALSSITITDVIERLDTLVNLFRTREIPRQLAIIDLMMDQLNLSSFFPGLAEASSKSLESNQYALSRIEEVLSKLKGSIKNDKSKEIDLLGQEASTSPDALDVEGVRSSLQSLEDKEKARKQQKKQEELAKIEEEIPEIEVEEDLAQPVEMPASMTGRTAPLAPPITAPTPPAAIRPTI